MSAIGTLWGGARQRQTKVILSVAALNGLEFNLPEFSFENKPAEFTEKFPYGKIPAFEGSDGFKLIEGAPIARYVASVGTKVNLLGSTAQESALIDQWVHYAEHEITQPATGILALIRGWFPFNRESLNAYFERLTRALKYLDAHLAARSSGYVALDTLTLADLIVAGTVYGAAHSSLGKAERAQYPHVFAHLERVTGDERVKQYWPTDGFADVRPTEPKAV